MRVKKASANRSNLVKDIVKIKNHEERRAKLCEYDGLMKTNIFGKKNNGYKVITQHTNKRESITKQPRYICLNRVTHYSAENFDDSRVLQQLNNGDAARPGTPLYEWLGKRHPFNNILNALSNGQNQIRIHLPNIKSESDNKTYRRDCLYHWDQDNQTLAVSEQDKDQFKKHYSMLDPVSGDYFNYMVMREGAGDGSVIVIDTLHDSQVA
jgi:hypothetical protein